LNNPEVVFLEHGLSFMAHVLKGHKTGYFLDHRANRKRVGEFARGKTVLDVFAYAGGFSVHALAGGASEVTSVDVSRQALELAQRNAHLNPYTGEHLTICGDAFEVLRTLGDENRLFDVVVIDPPSFAKRASEVSGAELAYKRLVRMGKVLVAPGGVLVMASCSSRIKKEQFFDLVEEELQKGSRVFQLESSWGHDIDHPVGFPEGAYLKCGFWKVDS
jgi:23S rRNA (cytosine1962-C5)-methyltransferase